jgi:hypothetical protein
MLGERRRGGVLSSCNRVAGFMPHLLGARWRLDLEELHDLDAPELVDGAQAYTVRVCRVAETSA